jgi:hypothetical protein
MVSARNRCIARSLDLIGSVEQEGGDAATALHTLVYEVLKFVAAIRVGFDP